ncbi:MAG: hypothetical protein QOK17_2679 [Sphingomonadales bacterium]|jgi:hypothetical protein|nr:hypothetical protein [Sphingomonadales bacterium]
MPKRVTVTEESDSGRNQRFHDNFSGADMTRAQFVREIERGNYDHYHVREINGVKTPVSNPDNSTNNNLD